MTPIWKSTLSDFELGNVRSSFIIEDESPVQFLAPKGLNTAYYQELFPDASIRRVPDEFMRSVGQYNALISQPAFYEAYVDFDFLVIVQTDAFLVRSPAILDMSSIDYLGVRALRLAWCSLLRGSVVR